MSLLSHTPEPFRVGPVPLDPVLLSAGRAGLGALMLAAPAQVARTLGTPTVSAQDGAWATRMLGAREVAVGLGSVVGLRSNDRTVRRTWLLAGLVCDLADLAIFGAAVRSSRLPRGSSVASVVVASSAVAVQALALTRN